MFIVTSPSSLSSPQLTGIPTLHFPPYTKDEYLEIISRLGPPPSPTPSTTSASSPTTATAAAAVAAVPVSCLPNSTTQETADLWARFAAAVHDALVRTAGPRTLPALRRACAALWPRFTAPVAAGTHRAREFGRLLVAARLLFQDEAVLQPGILMLSSSTTANRPLTTTTTTATAESTTKTTTTTITTITTTTTDMVAAGGGTALSAVDHGSTAAGARAGAAGKGSARGATATAGADLAALLPLTPRLLLIAAYLASHNTPRHDQTLFSTWHLHQRRRGRGRGRRRGAGAGAGGGRGGHRHQHQQHRRIARKLLGPGAFVLERMVAIYVATRREWVDDDSDSDDSDDGNGNGGRGMTVDGDVGMAIATLASLRLLVRVGGGAAASSSGGGGGWGGGGADLDRWSKWRVNVGWEVIRALGRSMGVEVEDWLID